MHTTLNTKHGPPETDNATTISPAHSPHSQPTLTESYIASEFMKRHGHCIRRQMLDDIPSFQLASIVTYNPPGVTPRYTVKKGCFRLPNSHVLELIRALTTELSANSDAFTQVRVNSSKFIFGALSLLLGVKRVPKLPDPPRDEYDPEAVNAIIALPRMEPERYCFEEADEHWMKTHARKYG